ncbi:hypothetical protein P4133_04425 [Pseudomonas aeruginosa]|nr:hypothetical protein [Pseudomonas aeruginosa]
MLGNLLAVQPLSHFMRARPTSRADARRQAARLVVCSALPVVWTGDFLWFLSRRAGHRGLPGLGHVYRFAALGAVDAGRKAAQRLRARRRCTRCAAGMSLACGLATCWPSPSSASSADRRAGPRRPAADGPAPRSAAAPRLARLAWLRTGGLCGGRVVRAAIACTAADTGFMDAWS